MTKAHIVLTEQEFSRLSKARMMPLDKLPISDAVKKSLMSAALKKMGGGARADDGPPTVECHMEGDAVVCVVHRSAKPVIRNN